MSAVDGSWGFGLCIMFGNGTPSLLGSGKWDVGAQANVHVCVSLSQSYGNQFHLLLLLYFI